MGVQDVIDKVKKLLSLSKSSNANEAAAAAAAANRLIDQHRLSMAELENNEDAEFDPLVEDQDYVYQSGRITQWKTAMIHVLCQHYGLTYWNDATWQSGRRVSRYRLVGKLSDIAIVKYMCAWLTVECQRLSDKEAKGKGRVYVNSYCNGFVNGIGHQLQISRDEAQKQASSQAIVRINARLEEAKEFLGNIHPDLVYKKNYSSNRHNEHAFNQGKERGKSTHLGSALNSGPVKLLK